jgi:hypothetical protein
MTLSITIKTNSRSPRVTRLRAALLCRPSRQQKQNWPDEPLVTLARPASFSQRGGNAVSNTAWFLLIVFGGPVAIVAWTAALRFVGTVLGQLFCGLEDE